MEHQIVEVVDLVQPRAGVEIVLLSVELRLYAKLLNAPHQVEKLFLICKKMVRQIKSPHLFIRFKNQWLLLRWRLFILTLTFAGLALGPILRAHLTLHLPDCNFIWYLVFFRTDVFFLFLQVIHSWIMSYWLLYNLFLVSDYVLQARGLQDLCIAFAWNICWLAVGDDYLSNLVVLCQLNWSHVCLRIAQVGNCTSLKKYGNDS